MQTMNRLSKETLNKIVMEATHLIRSNRDAITDLNACEDKVNKIISQFSLDQLHSFIAGQLIPIQLIKLEAVVYTTNNPMKIYKPGIRELLGRMASINLSGNISLRAAAPKALQLMKEKEEEEVVNV